MVTVLGTVYGLEGISQVEATERVEFIFKLLDTNGDEEISEEEFIKGCLEDQELVKLLQPWELVAIMFNMVYFIYLLK